MEKRQKEIVWTKRAVRDLRKAYDFNAEIQGEAKALTLVQAIIVRVDFLVDARFTDMGSADEAFTHLKRDYRKLIEGHHKITYRKSTSDQVIYINRVFDTRQNLKKNR